jgi:hypothetical protein
VVYNSHNGVYNVYMMRLALGKSHVLRIIWMIQRPIVKCEAVRIGRKIYTDTYFFGLLVNRQPYNRSEQ